MKTTSQNIKTRSLGFSKIALCRRLFLGVVFMLQASAIAATTILTYPLSPKTALEVHLISSPKNEDVRIGIFVHDSRLPNVLPLMSSMLTSSKNTDQAFKGPIEIPATAQIQGELPKGVSFESGKSLSTSLMNEGLFAIRSHPKNPPVIDVYSIPTSIQSANAVHFKFQEPPKQYPDFNHRVISMKEIKTPQGVAWNMSRQMLASVADLDEHGEGFARGIVLASESGIVRQIRHDWVDFGASQEDLSFTPESATSSKLTILQGEKPWGSFAKDEPYRFISTWPYSQSLASPVHPQMDTPANFEDSRIARTLAQVSLDPIRIPNSDKTTLDVLKSRAPKPIRVPGMGAQRSEATSLKLLEAGLQVPTKDLDLRTARELVMREERSDHLVSALLKIALTENPEEKPSIRRRGKESVQLLSEYAKVDPTPSLQALQTIAKDSADSEIREMASRFAHGLATRVPSLDYVQCLIRQIKDEK